MRKSAAVTGETRVKGVVDDTSSTPAHSPSRSLVFLHGGEASATVTASLAADARKRGLAPTVLDMTDFKKVQLESERCVVLFVVETVENAQPAEAAGPCVRYFNRKRKAGEKGLLTHTLRRVVGP